MTKKRKPLISQLSTDTRDLQDNLALAAAATQSQTSTARRMPRSVDMGTAESEKSQQTQPLSMIAGETMMKSAELQLMTPLLNFLQLLCENHNIKLQNYLRKQTHSKTSYNLILETLRFLDCICGVTTGGLVLLSLYINANNVELINQCLETLTEYCQGPCHDNQRCIASNESSGIDIIVQIILTELTALDDYQEMAMRLKSNASETLLAIMESHQDMDIMDRILVKIGNPESLVAVCIAIYNQGEEETKKKKSRPDDENTRQDDDEVASPSKVGHNIYILAYKLSEHKRELKDALDHAANEKAIEYYHRNTANIEIVRNDRKLEQIVFPVPSVCKYLTKESKESVLQKTQCNEQGSKVDDFFKQTQWLFEEMQCQKELREHRFLFEVSSRMNSWSSIAFYFAVAVNIIVASFYPYHRDHSVLGFDLKTSFALWLVLLLMGATLFYNQKFLKQRLVVLTTLSIIRGLVTLGVQPTLSLMGLAQLVNKGVFMLGLTANRGFFHKSANVELRPATLQVLKDVFLTKDLFYHWWYLFICMLGLLGHDFFYCLLLFDIIARYDTLQNVISSVTRNITSILLTLILAVILMYDYSILGYLFFSEDFMISTNPMAPSDSSVACSADVPGCDGEGLTEWPVEMERSCDTLVMCLITTIKEGVRAGGGISDVLRKPASSERLFLFRMVFDLTFFFLVIVIIIQNLVFGVIIDTFSDLRSEKNKEEDMIKNTCFICGLERGKFENKDVTYQHHIGHDHKVWNYLFFIVHLKMKDTTEFTGPESYVYEKINNGKAPDLEWFPRLRCMSLDTEDSPEQEQNEMKELQRNLVATTAIVKTLSSQLNELKDKMVEQRKFHQRKNLQDQLPQNKFGTL